MVDGGWLTADGARSEKSLARTLFLVFGGKTIGMYPLLKIIRRHCCALLLDLMIRHAASRTYLILLLKSFLKYFK